jgi:hypothetical protein
MTSITRYTFDKAVQDTKQLDLFLVSHMGDPFLFSETNVVEGCTYVHTSEQESAASTQDAIAAQLERYPDPPTSARGPVSTVLVDVSSGGTGRATFPSNSIILGMEEGPLSVDETLKFDPMTKTLGVASIR